MSSQMIFLIQQEYLAFPPSSCCLTSGYVTRTLILLHILFSSTLFVSLLNVDDSLMDDNLNEGFLV